MSHFMFDPEWTDGCPSCTAGADERAPGLYEHVETRNTAFVHVSRARLATIEDDKRRKGWTFPWVSSFGGDFNSDVQATADPDVAPVEHT